LYIDTQKYWNSAFIAAGYLNSLSFLYSGAIWKFFTMPGLQNRIIIFENRTATPGCLSALFHLLIMRRLYVVEMVDKE
jgi:hypothetical protein